MKYFECRFFSRAFKKATGDLPSTYKNKKQYIYERAEITEQYFEKQDMELAE